MLRVALGLLFLAGCYSSRPADQAIERAPVAACPEAQPGPRAKWRHRWGSAAASSLIGQPHHAASDPVVNPGSDAIITAKFAYGTASKDLEDEDVTLWMQAGPCARWDRVATARTDSDGRTQLQVPAKLIGQPGAYPFQLIVDGDHSRAYGTVFVVPPRARTVVFDIDGTLTTSDAQLAKQLALGDDPAARPGGNAIAQQYARSGYLLIYITGRPYFLRESSRDWLRRHQFPLGVLVTTESLNDSRPSPQHVGTFKRRTLETLMQGSGLDVRYAFGNASTDVCAYAEAGIPPEVTYIVGKHGGDACGDYAPSQRLSDYRTFIAPGIEPDLADR
jgi:phosphatidate phosphatase PAH1